MESSDESSEESSGDGELIVYKGRDSVEVFSSLTFASPLACLSPSCQKRSQEIKSELKSRSVRFSPCNPRLLHGYVINFTYDENAEKWEKLLGEIRQRERLGTLSARDVRIGATFCKDMADRAKRRQRHPVIQ